MKKYSTIISAMLFFLFITGAKSNCAPMIDIDFDNDEVELSRVLDVDVNAVDAKLIKTIVTRFCYISFVDIGGVEYIVKQKKEDCFRKIVGAVRDAITAHIAEDFGIAHRVVIIPAGKKFPGKPRTDWPATLHTIAPGKMVKAQNSKYNGMNIKQANIGFRRDMLVWMMKHPILLMMVAMDTFLCNHDRHRGNLFYLPKNESGNCRYTKSITAATGLLWYLFTI